MIDKLHIAVACGGTGGHLFPGLAAAHCLRARGHDVTLWLTGREGEREAADGWSGAMETVPASGFQRNRPLGYWRALVSLIASRRMCLRRMRTRRPDALLAMGSYASVGPAWAAFALHIPVVVHESNVIPGRANRMLSRRAACTAASFEETRFYMKHTPIEVTGMPLRRSLQSAAEAVTGEQAAGEPLHLLIMGGSMGARAVNLAASAAVCGLLGEGGALRVTHLTGVRHEEETRAAYGEWADRVDVRGFCADMAPLYLSAGLAVSRSGASSCAELLAFCVPALLVPYPHAVHDHQMMNARAMEKMKCADVIPEAELSPAWLIDYVKASLEHPVRLERMRKAALSRGVDHSAERVADLVEKAARERQ